MGIHLNDHIDWWFLLPVDCYRQRCMRHVEHTPLKGMLRNMEPSGSVWGLILKVLDTMGLKAQGLQTVNLVFSYEACPKMLTTSWGSKTRISENVWSSSSTNVTVWIPSILKARLVVMRFLRIFGEPELLNDNSASVGSPRTNVESKQAKTPESKTASHQAEPSVKWD